MKYKLCFLLSFNPLHVFHFLFSKPLLNLSSYFFFSASLIRASLSSNIGMSCSCSSCPGESSYRWYHRSGEGQQWVLLNSDGASMMPQESGTYACRVVWNNGRSLLSNDYACKFLLMDYISPDISISICLPCLKYM